MKHLFNTSEIIYKYFLTSYKVIDVMVVFFYFISLSMSLTWFGVPSTSYENTSSYTCVWYDEINFISLKLDSILFAMFLMSLYLMCRQFNFCSCLLSFPQYFQKLIFTTTTLTIGSAELVTSAVLNPRDQDVGCSQCLLLYAMPDTMPPSQGYTTGFVRSVEFTSNYINFNIAGI